MNPIIEALCSAHATLAMVSLDFRGDSKFTRGEVHEMVDSSFEELSIVLKEKLVETMESEISRETVRADYAEAKLESLYRLIPSLRNPEQN